MLPIFLKVQDVPVLVVGGGEIAQRKALWLLEQGARVRVVATEMSQEMLATAAARAEVTLIHRAYRPTDCDGVRLVVAATNDEDTNARVASDAKTAGLWVNVVDRPALCTFFVPATGAVGPIQVAVGTSGTSPALAAVLRDHLMAQLPHDLGQFAAALATIRERHCAGRDFDWRARAMRRAAAAFSAPDKPTDAEALVAWLLARMLEDDSSR